MAQALEEQVPRYPLSRDDAGPAFWQTLHHVLLAYPEKPEKRDWVGLANFVKTWLESFPCDECVSEGKLYLRDNPPPFEAGQHEMRMFGCRWQNDVRRRLGKQQVNCDAMIASTGKACSTCKGDYYDVRSALNGIKRASKRIIQELSERENVPPPKLVFQPCPSMPDAAGCTRLPEGIIFIDPKRFQLKSLVHEFFHYSLAYKGRSELEYSNEEEMDRMAYQIIENEFKYDRGYYPADPKERDYRDLNNSGRDLYDMEDVSDCPMCRENQDLYDEDDEYYSDEEPQDYPDNEDRGFLGGFEKLYMPFSKILRTSEQELNEAHTPEIIGNLAVLGSEYFLSPFGALVSSTVGSFILMGVSSTSQMARGDRRLVNELSSHLLWNGIRYLNPKLNASAGAFAAGSSAAKGDIGGLISSFTAEVQEKEVRSLPIQKPPPPPPQAVAMESMATSQAERLGEQLAETFMGSYVPAMGK